MALSFFDAHLGIIPIGAALILNEQVFANSFFDLSLLFGTNVLNKLA